MPIYWTENYYPKVGKPFFLASEPRKTHHVRMKRIGWLGLIAWMMVGQGWASSPGNTHLFRNTVLEEVSFRKAPLDEVIAFLREQTKRGEEQVNFVIPPQTQAAERIVTLDLRNVQAVDAFATILRMTGTRAEVRQNMVWILPRTP